MYIPKNSCEGDFRNSDWQQFFFSFMVITKKRENTITLALLFFARNLIILLKPILMEYIPVIKIFSYTVFLLISKRLWTDLSVDEWHQYMIKYFMISCTQFLKQCWFFCLNFRCKVALVSCCKLFYISWYCFRAKTIVSVVCFIVLLKGIYSHLIENSGW